MSDYALTDGTSENLCVRAHACAQLFSLKCVTSPEVSQNEK